MSDILHWKIFFAFWLFCPVYWQHLTIYASSLSSSQIHGSAELSSFCEGYFLQQMPALLEREAFKTLLLGPPAARQGNNSTSTLVHSRQDSPLEELEATLAQRLRSLHITSRVWGEQDSCWGKKTVLRRQVRRNVAVGAALTWDSIWKVWFLWVQMFTYIWWQAALSNIDTGTLIGDASLWWHFSVGCFVSQTPTSIIIQCTVCLESRELDCLMLSLHGSGSCRRRSNSWSNRWELWVMKHCCPLVD